MFYKTIKQSLYCIMMCSLMLISCGIKKISNNETNASESTSKTLNTSVKNEMNESNHITNIVETEDQDFSKVSDTSDPFKLPIISKIKGTHLKAISTASVALATDNMIPESKRSLENYDVELRQDKGLFFVYFSAHSSEQDKLELVEGGETSLGKSVMFVITKNSYAIRKRYFFK